MNTFAPDGRNDTTYYTSIHNALADGNDIEMSGLASVQSHGSIRSVDSTNSVNSLYSSPGGRSSGAGRGYASIGRKPANWTSNKSVSPSKKYNYSLPKHMDNSSNSRNSNNSYIINGTGVVSDDEDDYDI